MELSKARQLREQRFKLVKDAREAFDAVNPPTTEARAKFDQAMIDADAMLEDITRLEKVDAVLAEGRSLAPPNAAVQHPGISDEDRQAKLTKAFRSYLRAGFATERTDNIPVMTAEERQTLREFRDGMTTGGGNVLQGTGGGYFVPVGFVNKIEAALKYYGPMLVGGIGNPTILETATGQPLPFPTDNDTTVTGELVGESQTVDTASVVSLGAIIFGAFKYSTRMVKVSIELLQDSAFDIESFLVDKFAIRMGRILNTHFTTGAGGGNLPTGIVPASTLGVTFTGSNTNDGLGLAAGESIGSDDLINLEHAVDILYRRGAKYMMHDTTLRALKTLKDRYGRPLWLPSLSANAPDTINGYGYLVNNDMDQIPSQASSPVVTKKTMLFGALDKYMIRRVKGLSILRLDERFAELGQVAFIGYARYDGNLLDAGTHPVVYGRNAY